MGIPFMKCLVELAKKSNFSMTTQITHMARSSLSGPLATKIIEDMNQRLRDIETRVNASKNVKHMQQWNACADAGLFARNGREDFRVDVARLRPMPGHKLAEELFTKSYPTNLVEALDFKRITGEQAWTTYNAAGLGKYVAEAQLMLHLNATDSWHRAEEFWLVRLIPEGEWLFDMESTQLFFVVYRCPWAMLTWQCNYNKNKRWTWAFAKELQWRFVDDLAKYRVVPSEAYSMLHARLAHGKSADTTICFEQARKPEDVLVFQASRGWGSLLEEMLAPGAVFTQSPSRVQ
jgi:hypothetical protein